MSARHQSSKRAVERNDQPSRLRQPGATPGARSTLRGAAIRDRAILRGLIRSAQEIVAAHRPDDAIDGVIARLARAEKGRYRFVGGTCELRISGVTATCTAGGVQLLKAWMRKAERRIAELGR